MGAWSTIAQSGQVKMASSFDHLQDFIRKRMRMSHIYQPVMIRERELLTSGGRSSIRSIPADVGVTALDFRAVASTALNEMGFRPDVIERQLAHQVQNAVRAAYNRAEYLKERRVMMLHWADHVDAMVGGNVVPFNSRAALKRCPGLSRQSQ
jgi:integrase